MNDNKKPSEPVEEERWALENVPTVQLAAELASRNGVLVESSWWCKMSCYHVIIRLDLKEEERPPNFEKNFYCWNDPKGGKPHVQRQIKKSHERSET